MATSMNCTSETCPVPAGFLWSEPSLAASAFMLAAFGALIPVHVFAGLYYRTPLFSATMVTGLLVEEMGFAGRLLLRNNLANRTYFVLYLLGTITGPTLVAAAIFLVLPHLLAIYGRDVRLVSRPVYVGVVFFAFDIFTLAFQVVGSAFTANGVSKLEMKQGVNILMAGLAIQIVSLAAFLCLLYAFFVKVKRYRHLVDRQHAYAAIHQSNRFRIFLLCLQISPLLLLLRTAFRLAQLSYPQDSPLAQSQTLPLILDNAAVLLAALTLSILPPGRAFSPQIWARTSPRRRPARRPASLPLAAQRSPYNTYTFGPHALGPGTGGSASVTSPGAGSAGQTPAHWMEPGFAKPAVGGFGGVGGVRTSQQRSPRSGGGLVAVGLPASPAEGSPGWRATMQSAVSGGGGSPEWSPGVEELERGGGAGKRGSAGAGTKKKRDVVDPDALW